MTMLVFQSLCSVSDASAVSEGDDPLMEGDYRERPGLALVKLVFCLYLSFALKSA